MGFLDVETVKKNLLINGYFDGLNELVLHKATSLGYKQTSSQNGVFKFEKGSLLLDPFWRELTCNVLLHPKTIDITFSCNYFSGAGRSIVIERELSEIIEYLTEWLLAENITFRGDVKKLPKKVPQYLKGDGLVCPKCGRVWPPASKICWDCGRSLG
mgnify:CR=1 FL=1